MEYDTTDWPMNQVYSTNISDAIPDALSEFEKANRAAIDEARVDGKPGIWFSLTGKLEEIMKEFSKDFRAKYPTATFHAGHPIVVFSSRPHIPLPGYTKTGYVVLRSRDMKDGSIRWGEEDLGEGCYIPFGVR